MFYTLFARRQRTRKVAAAPQDGGEWEDNSALLMLQELCACVRVCVCVSFSFIHHHRQASKAPSQVDTPAEPRRMRERESGKAGADL